ncbi:MAG: aminopeptidase P family protein [Bacteroidia bacterium]|nr:aminopeptidase P family protein [Bacteroidia bacterium]
MRYKSPPSELFIKNRKAFAGKMESHCIAIFHANDLYPSNGDANYKFVQNNNLYYLTGLDQEEVILVLFPDAPEERFREMLFIKATNKHIQVWEGWKYSKKEARAVSGIETVYFFKDFENVISRLLYHFSGIYLDINEHSRLNTFVPSAAHRLAEKFRQTYPTHQLHRAAPIMEDLRVIKKEAEIEMLEKAVSITGDAFHRVLGFVEAGQYEYEIEAEILHEFIRQGASGTAFDTIVASGKDSCVLHYIHNDKEVKDGDLILIDMGARYGNYCADMTRTIPVNGRFSTRQRDIYKGTLAILKFATSQLVVGNTFENYNKEVGKFITEQCIELGLLKKEDLAKEDANDPQAYRKYCMHGISHFLGLDTHDVGSKYQSFKAGMLLTCEPGLYIPEENIGIRLENDILISEEGPINLMKDILLEAEEVEEAMAKNRTIK